MDFRTSSTPRTEGRRDQRDDGVASPEDRGPQRDEGGTPAVALGHGPAASPRSGWIKIQRAEGVASPGKSRRKGRDDGAPARRIGLRRGFTLVEILISAGLASIVLTGVMTTFVMMARTGVLAQNYTELEVEARKALELFSREARMAYAVTAYSATSVTLSIPDLTYDRTATLYNVTYSFDTTAKTFSRTGPPITNPTGASSTTVLVTNVLQIGTTDFFRYFRYVTSGYATGFTSNYATNSTEIKQVELNFIAKRAQTGVASATDKVLSARFILRNK